MKRILTILLLIVCSQAYSQSPDYYVFLVKGEVSVSKAGAKPIPLQQNVFIYKDQLITVKKDAELTLADKNQNFLVLRSPAVYKVKDLDNKKNDPIQGVTQTFLKLAWNQLIHPDHDFKQFTNDNSSVVYGGVSRGDDCDNLIFPIKNLKTSEDSIRFKWHQSSPSNDYTFIIYDSTAKEVVNIAVKDTQHTVKINEALHGNTGKYYWVVKGKEPGCEEDPISFEIKNKEGEQKLIPALVIQKGSNDVLSQLQIVDALEKDKWIHTAMKYYATIVQGNPGNDPLVKSYVLFLLKYGFDEEAYNSWKKIKLN